MIAENLKKIRPAVKAGTWYPSDKTALLALLATFDAGKIVRDSRSRIIAGVVPHAGLIFSGAMASQVFRALKTTSPDLETFIIFGAVHTEHLAKPAIWRDGEWETPLGNIAVDNELAEKLLAEKIGDANYSPHYQDNAIELQTPLIKHYFLNAKILPIATPPSPNAAEWGERVAAIVQTNQLTDRVAAIASTDLTHYGVDYGFAPAGTGEAAHQWSKENDARLLALAQNFAAEKIVAQAEKDHSACGAGALAATVAYAKKLGAKTAEISAHRTSWEVLRDLGENSPPEMFVGYAAMLFTD